MTNGRGTRTVSPDVHTLTGAYALHALDPDEAAGFECHLRDCRACAEEVRGFRESAARLAVAVADSPPPALRERVLTAVVTVRQLPPLVAVSASAAVPPVRHARPRRRAMLLAAACAVVLAVLGGVSLGWSRMDDRGTGTARRADALSLLLAAPDAVTLSAPVRGGGTARVVLSRARGELALVTSGLPRPPDAHAYQLWFDDGGHMRPAGMVEPGRTTVVPGTGDAVGVGLTVEPEGGSPQPSGEPIMLIGLPRT